MTAGLDPGKDGPSGSDPRPAFVLALGRALHSAGETANRLEDLLHQVTRRVGLEAQFFITPTSIFAAFGPEDRQRTHLIRTEPAPPDLGQLARLDTVVVRVLRGELSPENGLREVEQLKSAPRQPRALRVLGYALASAGAARLLGGGLREILVSGGVGMAIGLLSLLADRRDTLQRLFEAIGSFTGALLVGVIAHLIDGLTFLVTALASLIVLVPGMSLTNAMAELTTRHLASGTARLMSAFMVFIAMGFGAALAAQLVLLGFGPPPNALVVPLPGWTEWLAILVASASFGLLLRARPRDFGWILMACLVGFAAARVSARLLGPELGMFLGALGVGLTSSLVARWADQPVAITEVPGILILVPGSIGFRSITALLEKEVISGVETGFRVLLIAMSLVAGLLVANLLVRRPRRL
jgi:uncharacterized membrane protein YjjP (DUF1212 family)